LKRIYFLCIVLLWSLQVCAGEVRIASWNIQHLGWGENKHYEALARIGSKFDLIAVQEVMTAEGLYGLHASLERETSERWGKIYSHRIGRGSYREKYAYIYRKSRIKYLDGALVFLDLQDNFAREPFAARFETADGAHRFIVATIHILYGQSKRDRLPEIQALADMWRWLEESFPDDDNLLLMGDFNLRPGYPAFEPLREVAKPMITRGATTLSTIDRRFANLYDHIWVGHRSNLTITDSGIVEFPAILGWTHEQARRHASDHAPVYIQIESPGPFPPRRSGASTLRPGPSDPPAFSLGDSDRTGEIRGNRNSQIYHHAECPGYDKIAEHNRVHFRDEEAAQQAGFRRARNCGWPAPM
jgi:endonuclease/exonuclease/phosphatase family metal-dependent hydrolase